MFIYLALVLVFGFLLLVSMGALVYGLIKSRKKLWVISGILLVVSGLACLFSAVALSKSMISYVRSDQFQKDANKGSQLVGETVGSVSSGLSKGLSNTLDEEAITRLAHKSGNILGKSIKTIASSLDSTLGNKSLFEDQNLQDAGLELGHAEVLEDTVSGLGIFISFHKQFRGTFKLTNYDQSGKKVDFAESEVDAKAGEEKRVIFRFPHTVMGLTTYYILAKEE